MWYLIIAITLIITYKRIKNDLMEWDYWQEFLYWKFIFQLWSMGPDDIAWNNVISAVHQLREWIGYWFYQTVLVSLMHMICSQLRNALLIRLCPYRTKFGHLTDIWVWYIYPFRFQECVSKLSVLSLHSYIHNWSSSWGAVPYKIQILASCMSAIWD